MNISQYLQVPEPVDWRQGMLLSPQHFQQQEAHIDRLTTHKLYLSQPHYWGLIDINIDSDDLSRGRVSISRLHAVLPDGQVIDFSPSESEAPLEVEVDESQFADDGVNAVMISVAALRRGTRAGDTQSGGAQQRYESIEYPDITDENNADQKIDIKKKKLLIQLFASNKIPGRFVSLPLFRLVRRQDNSYEIGRYHPPMLAAQVSEKLLKERSLWRHLEDLAKIMRKRASVLASAKTGVASDRVTIAALIGRLPKLEVLLNTPMTHPFPLYLAFVDLLSDFMTLEYVDDFFEPCGYDHDNPLRCFDTHLRELKRKVKEIQLPFESYPFVETEPGQFSLDLPSSANPDELVIALVPPKGQDPRISTSWLNSALVGTDRVLDSLEKQRLRGAQRREMSGHERIQKRPASHRQPVGSVIRAVLRREQRLRRHTGKPQTLHPK